MMRLQYKESGRAEHPAVVFLHGFMGSAADWDEVVGMLRRTYHCLAVDLPGHGATGDLGGAEPYTMPGAARLLRALLDGCGVERCALVGYSMGGRLALYFAVHHPERCSRLVLVSASPGLQSEVEREARRGVDEARAVRLETEPFSVFLDEWYRQPLFATLDRHEGLRARLVAARSRNAPAALARVLRGMGTGLQPPLWERLAGLEVSTLAVAGALDGKYVEVAQRMAVLSDRVRSAIIPNVGHAVHAEAPHAFADLLRDFLKHP